MEGNLLCGREFQDLEDLRNCARWWLAKKSDLHVHETTGRPPLELFLEREIQALTPLPLHPYDCAEVALRVCDLDGYLDFETNRYPVPYEYGADILTMKVTEHEVLVYSPELTLVVRHERVPDGSRVTLDGSAVHRVKTLRYGLEPMREQFLQLGEHAEEFLSGLTFKNSKNPGFHARYILHLKERYACDDINLALGHACRYHAYDCKAVERILATKATPRTLESVRNEKAAQRLRAALPKIKQRPLDDYAGLFVPHHREATPNEEDRQCRQNQDIPEDLET